MVVPTDLQVRLERFTARWLPLRACTVSTGIEGCQRDCTRARFLADSRTLESCRRFAPDRTLERKLRLRSRPGRCLAGPGRLRRDLRIVLRRLRRLLEPAGRRALRHAHVDV